MKKGLLLMSVFASIFFLAGCTQAPRLPAADTGAETGPIKIGVIAPLAGAASTYGQDAMHAYNYVVDKVNAEGGINGRQVELIPTDGACGGKEATTAVQKLINIDGVELILGGVCSAETIPAGNIAQQQGVVLVSATSSSPEVSTIGDYVFRYWNDLEAGAAMAAYLQNQGAAKIAIFNENTDYSIGYAKIVEENFSGEVIMKEKINSDEKDLAIVAKKIIAVSAEVDYIVFIPNNEALNLGVLQALQNEGALDQLRTKLMGGELILTDATIAEMGTALEGLKTVILTDQLGGESATLLAGLTDDYEIQSTEVFMMLWADAADLVFEAIAEVGYEADAIRDYIAGFTVDAPREALIGDFWFDAEGDGQGLAFVVKEMVGGELVVVE